MIQVGIELIPLSPGSKQVRANNVVPFARKAAVLAA